MRTILFYNMNRMLIAVGLEEYTCLSTIGYAIFDVEEEEEKLQPTVCTYRLNRTRYEMGAIDIRYELANINPKL